MRRRATALRRAAFLAAALGLALAAADRAGARALVPAPEITTLENGLRVAVFPDARLPLVHCALLLPAGSTAEGPGQEGLANLTAVALRNGTSSRSVGAFGAELERFGATLQAGAGRDYATVSATFLARDLDAGLELLADAVLHPVFPDDEVGRLERQVALGLVQSAHDPDALADDALWSLAFRGGVYGHPPAGKPEALARLQPDDLRAFHRDHYRPGGAVLAIAGDVTSAQALAAAREWFGSWAGRAAAVAAATAPPRPAGPRVLIVDQPELARAEIRLGAPAAPRDAPDYLALALANQCLGGPGANRLAAAGAPPDARSALTPLRGTGLFTLAASARPESAAAVATRLRGALASFLAAPPGAEETARARTYFRGVLPLALETAAGRVGEWLAADAYGLPADFFARYDERVAGLAPADLAAAARHWLDPARLDVVAVGPAAQLRPALAPFGAVEVVTAPAPRASTEGFEDLGPPPPARAQRGRELFTRAIAAHGGEERLRRIHDSVVEGELVISQGGHEVRGTLRQLRKEPMRMLYVTQFDGFETRQTLKGDSAWSSAGPDTMAVMDADSMLAEGQRARFRSDLPHLLLLAREPGVRVVAQGPDSVAGHAVEAVRLDSPRGERRRYYFDAANGRLVALDEPAPPNVGRIARRLYSDYRTVDGVLWPMSEERMVDGQRLVVMTARTVALDHGIPDTMFERPRRFGSTRGR